METTIFDLNYLGESSQEQLGTYRKVGSAGHLKRVRQRKNRRKKLLKRTLRALKNLFLGACLAFDLWIFISWIDIIADNISMNPVHFAWNFFVLFF